MNPFAGQTVFDTVNVEVSATDNVGVDTVKFSIDGLLVFEDNSFPFLYEWDTTVETEDEDHVISVVISDAAYNITYVPPISVFVNNEPADDTTPPIVVISNPLSGQTVSDTVDFTVLAQDNVGIELLGVKGTLTRFFLPSETAFLTAPITSPAFPTPTPT